MGTETFPPELKRLLVAAQAYVTLTSNYKLWTREEMDAIRYELREAMDKFTEAHPRALSALATGAMLMQMAA